MATAYIGTSGFSYPHWGNGVFYPPSLPQRKWFEYYLKYFNSVELNVSFYRLPKKEAFASWRKRAGKDFVFSIKGSRFITHIKKLKDCQEEVERFFEAAEGVGCGWVMGSESGCGDEDGKQTERPTPITHPRLTTHNSSPPSNTVLWQLPPGLRVDLERLELFLKILPKTWRHAFEFRHPSWVDSRLFTSLLHRNEVEATVVFQDWQDWPKVTDYAALYHGLPKLVKKLPFVYIRFHGSQDLYSSEYGEDKLKVWASDIRKWLKEGKDVYVYFNNDALGYAVSDALRLKKLVE